MNILGVIYRSTRSNYTFVWSALRGPPAYNLDLFLI